jgi:enamine deaminase RidA (YjgF/YER057c/UK114 family)
MSAAAIRRYPTPLPVPFSKAVRAGDFLFLSGVLAMALQGREGRDRGAGFRARRASGVKRVTSCGSSDS